jgi:hypothetical protein
VATRRAGAPFGAPRFVTPPGDARLPRGAVGPRGDVVAVWTAEGTTWKGEACGCSKLVGARGSLDGRFSRPRDVSPAGLRNWSVRRDEAGDLMAVWQLAGTRPGTADDRVEGRLVGGSGELSPLHALSPRGDHDDPRALLYARGRAFVAWSQTRGPHDRVQFVEVRVRP